MLLTWAKLSLRPGDRVIEGEWSGMEGRADNLGRCGGGAGSNSSTFNIFTWHYFSLKTYFYFVEFIRGAGRVVRYLTTWSEMINL